jgi:hypothetical protein
MSWIQELESYIFDLAEESTPLATSLSLTSKEDNCIRGYPR